MSHRRDPVQSLAGNSPGEASYLCECGNRFRGTAGGEGVALRRRDRCISVIASGPLLEVVFWYNSYKSLVLIH